MGLISSLKSNLQMKLTLARAFERTFRSLHGADRNAVYSIRCILVDKFATKSQLESTSTPYGMNSEISNSDEWSRASDEENTYRKPCLRRDVQMLQTKANKYFTYFCINLFF